MLNTFCQDQIEWFLQQSASIDPIERPFKPDTPDDVWERQSDQIAPTTRKLAKPNALMFFHIPLYVATSFPKDDLTRSLVLDKNHTVRQTLTVVQVYHSTLGYMDSRIQDLQSRVTGCLKMVCSRRWRASTEQEVSFPKSRSSRTAIATVSGIVAVGMRLLTGMPVTEDCKRVQDVWLCFGGGG